MSSYSYYFIIIDTIFFVELFRDRSLLYKKYIFYFLYTDYRYSFLTNFNFSYYSVFQDFHFEDEVVQEMFEKVKSYDLKSEIQYVR